jgi:hypothetical protein
MSETSGSTDEGRIFSSLYESDKRVTRLPTVSLETSTESATSTTAGVADQHLGRLRAAHILTIFPFGMYLDENLLGAHHLDHLAHVRAGLL